MQYKILVASTEPWRETTGLLTILSENFYLDAKIWNSAGLEYLNRGKFTLTERSL